MEEVPCPYPNRWPAAVPGYRSFACLLTVDCAHCFSPDLLSVRPRSSIFLFTQRQKFTFILESHPQDLSTYELCWTSTDLCNNTTLSKICMRESEADDVSIHGTTLERIYGSLFHSSFKRIKAYCTHCVFFMAFKSSVHFKCLAKRTVVTYRIIVSPFESLC